MAVIPLTPARGAPQVNGPPLARNLGGPAATMQAQGEALSQFGATLNAMAERREAARRQREVSTADAELAEGLTDLRGRMMRNDPAFADNPTEAFRREGTALLDRIAGRFDGDMRDLVIARGRGTMAGQALAVETFATQREAERTQADLQGNLDRLARLAAAEGDPLVRRGLMEQAEQAITGAAGAGALSAVQAQRLRQGFAGSLDLAQIRRLIVTNPGAALRGLGDGSLGQNLAPEQAASLLGTAQSAVQAAQARAEAATARQERRVMLAVGQVNGMLQAGIVPEQRVAEIEQLARGTALEPQVRQMVADGRQTQAFMLAPATQQAEMIRAADERRRGPNATDADQAHHARLVQAAVTQATAYQRDGLGRAVAEGLIPPQAPINWTDPATLNSRVEMASGVSAQRGYAISPFNTEDLAAGVAAFQSGNVDQRLAMVGAIAAIEDPAIRAAAMQHFERARGDAGRLPPGTLARVADMLRSGTVEGSVAARRLIGDLTADVGDRARQIGESQEMRSALVDAQGSGVQGVRVRQAEIAGGGPYAALVSRDLDAIQRAAAARMAAGESSATSAVRGAAGDLNAGLAVVDTAGFAHVYFPASRATPAQMTAGLRLLRDRAVAEIGADPSLGGDQAQAALLRRQATSRATWINEGGTFALVSPHQDRRMPPVVLRTATLDEIVRAADGQAAADQARPPVLRREDALERNRREMRQAPPRLQ